jgi:hypothetical protein
MLFQISVPSTIKCHFYCRKLGWNRIFWLGETGLHVCFLVPTSTHAELAKRMIRRFPKVWTAYWFIKVEKTYDLYIRKSINYINNIDLIVNFDVVAYKSDPRLNKVANNLFAAFSPKKISEDSCFYTVKYSLIHIFRISFTSLVQFF